MIDVNDLRKGVTFELDGNLWRVLDYAHHKPGRGNATIRIKARNLRTGSTLEKTFISGSQVQNARLDFHNVQYLYNDGNTYYFMDSETFDQPGIPKSILGDSAGFLTEGMECKLTFYKGEALDVFQLARLAKRQGWEGLELDTERPHAAPMDLDADAR